MKIFLDTNVLIDFLAERQPFFLLQHRCLIMLRVENYLWPFLLYR